MKLWSLVASLSLVCDALVQCRWGLPQAGQALEEVALHGDTAPSKEVLCPLYDWY